MAMIDSPLRMLEKSIVAIRAAPDEEMSTFEG